ncbi:MAG: hypothetical protein EAZ97_11120 [Bacteroidetes bacterium]|nr:MAG: hypothetical protein EAZ97_11120 [Bacteroidota bacterium]
MEFLIIFIVDLVIFFGIYFWLINKYELQGQIAFSFGLICLLVLLSYFVYNSFEPKKDICSCSQDYLEDKLQKISTKKSLANYELIDETLCCFEDRNLKILVKESVFSEEEDINISAKPIKISVKNYLNYLQNVYSGDSIKVSLMKQAENGQIIYLELQEINKK